MICKMWLRLHVLLLGTNQLGLFLLQHVFVFFVSSYSLFSNFIMCRIKHTYILDDPFEDPLQLAEFIPENSPLGKPHG